MVYGLHQRRVSLRLLDALVGNLGLLDLIGMKFGNRE